MNMETEHSQSVLEHMTTAVVLLDASERIIGLNHSAEMLFRVSARQVRGQSILSLAPGGDLLQSLVRDCARTGQSYTERERRLPMPGEQVATADITVTLLPGDQLLLELAEVDRQARISREQHLITQSRAIRELIRGLAHEIKNPLGGLRGAAQLLESELDRDELHEYTQVIIREADRLQGLVNTLLGPNTPTDPQPVNIHEVLEHVLSLVHAEDDQITLERDYDPSIPPIRAERNHLVQAALNLIRNAGQAAGPSGTVTVRSRSQRQFTIADTLHRLVARIDVIDDGPGIPEDALEQIFYPMVSSRPGGTGLGLPLAQDLVGRHGGLIECTSEPGCTIFTIWLPVEVEND